MKCTASRHRTGDDEVYVRRFPGDFYGFAEIGGQENEEAGQLFVQARAKREPLECISWFLALLKSRRRLHGRQQEENMLAGFKKNMIKKRKRRFSILKKSLPVCLRLGEWTGNRGK